MLRARSLLLNLYLRLFTFCSVELSPVSEPCCLLDSHDLSMFGVFLRILSILRGRLQDVPKPGSLITIGTFREHLVFHPARLVQYGGSCAESLYFPPFPDRLFPFNRSRPSIMGRKKDPVLRNCRCSRQVIQLGILQTYGLAMQQKISKTLRKERKLSTDSLGLYVSCLVGAGSAPTQLGWNR